MKNTPFIVAELSSSHLGSIDRALAIAQAAADAGADALKLQCWTPGMMAVAGEWRGESLPKLYERAFTPWEWFPVIFARCKELGLECFSSVFDVGALEYLETLGCPRYKISSFELVDLPLIRAVAKTGKPIILSTGMASIAEIDEACKMAGENDLTLLKCTSSYPAPVSEANLAVLANWKWRSGCPFYYRPWTSYGLSDHTTGHTVALAATALGASMIEKHLTLSRSDGGPDAGHSLEPDEFRQLVTECRRAAEALGEVAYGPTESECETVKLRRSLWIIKPVKTGCVIQSEHVACMRPADGLPPAALYSVIGRIAAHDLEAGTPLRWDMLDGPYTPATA